MVSKVSSLAIISAANSRAAITCSLECWNDGLMEYWGNGLFGMMECWIIDPRGRPGGMMELKIEDSWIPAAVLVIKKFFITNP